MKIYTVGGYVRDKFMGLEPKDRDYVVVGSTPQEMEALGYEQAGKDFPVFRHPQTQDEYALARTERKTGVGYNGFDVEISSVSLEEDLFRRDLTMNAMAMTEDGVVIDPYHGQEDIKNKLLRHVSVHFKEDPVRILRIARFSARYDFEIAPETLVLMKEMVANGEFDHLTGERVWKEFEKVLSEPHVKNFFNQLEKIGALERVPGFSAIHEKDFYRENYDLNLLHTFSQMNPADLKKWKMPSDEQQRIQNYSYWKNQNQFYSELSNEDKLMFVAKTKALHQPEKAEEMLEFIHTYQEWKQLHVRTLASEKIQFLHDLSLLKSIDYEVLVKDALANKQKPQEVVKEAQLLVLQPKKQLKLK